MRIARKKRTSSNKKTVNKSSPNKSSSKKKNGSTKKPTKSPKKRKPSQSKKAPIKKVTCETTKKIEKKREDKSKLKQSKITTTTISQTKSMDFQEEKKIPNVYFTSDTEAAITEYNHAFDQRDKDRIYNDRIKYAFEKIAENVYNTFKFSYSDVSPIEVQRQALSHMVANIDKYDSSKGRAFGYFSIIAKNWFILDNNSNYRRFLRQVEICDHPGESGEFVVEPEHQKRDSEIKEFVRLMVDFWDQNVEKYFPKKRDRDIASAVVELFRLSDRIDVFNKKALYLYIRDITDCQTQHITKVINKMKFAQRNITEEYFSNGTITGTHINIHHI